MLKFLGGFRCCKLHFQPLANRQLNFTNTINTKFPPLLLSPHTFPSRRHQLQHVVACSQLLERQRLGLQELENDGVVGKGHVSSNAFQKISSQ